MTQPFRAAFGGRIDRAVVVRFSFDGRVYEGCAGDTLASALLANDVHLVGRSFKYHRPRGIVSAGSEEPNALVTVDRGAGRVTPNLRATQVELYEGLRAFSQNRYPSLRFDFGAAAGLVARLLPPGFVYKSFMWPSGLWKRVYEPAIRRSAGLGRAPVQADPDRYMHRYGHCDVLVVGGGAAGLAAALGASATGARVVLCDEQAEFGGSLLGEPGVSIDGWASADWLGEVVSTLSDRVTLLPRTTAFGWYADHLIGLVERLTDHVAEPEARLPRERLWHMRAGRVILAAGAIERPLVFPGNDRPGVMLAGAARTYLHRYGVKVGRRAVVVTSDDSAYWAAVDLHAAGVTIAAIVDLRAEPGGAVVEAVRALGIPLYAGAVIVGTEGRGRVRSVRLAQAKRILTCDTVLMCGGWTPSAHLAGQSRLGLAYDTGLGCVVPASGAVGACAGQFDLGACLRDGTVAGGSDARDFVVAGVPEMARPGLPVTGKPHRKAFVDFQNDVTTRDLATAAAEGFVSIEHVKRYTTVGMATDQGKTSNVNVAAAVAGLTGQAVGSVGLTTFRPPFTPVTFGALAGPGRGALFAPVRVTPIVAADAVAEDAEGWRGARCYPLAGETIEAAVTRECLAVRSAAGMFDASAQGKIEVCGPDAGIFLDRIYASSVADLEVGRWRYGLLLGEDGFIRDDGIVARLDAERFHVTTTAGGAAFVLHHMEDYLQGAFADLRAWVTAVTEQWAVIAVQGPRSAEVLAPFIEDIALDAMQHGEAREGHIGDSPIRLFRGGFMGEMGFEVNLPPDGAQAVWDTLRQQTGVTACGAAAKRVLWAEAGSGVIGQETDGTVTADDLGLGETIAWSKDDFVGKRSLSLADLVRTDRKQLVGLLPADPSVVLEEGVQLTEPGQTVSVGHVTASYRSVALGRGFALALVAGGRSRIGGRLHAAVPWRSTEVTVTKPRFYDTRAEEPLARMVSLPLLPAVAPVALVARPVRSARLAVLAPARLLSVRAGMGAATAIGMAIGVLLPTAPCRSVIARERAALWLGPDEWLIQAPEGATGLVAQARRAAGGYPASVVDVSQRSRVLEISGERAAWCLNAFCALDLDVQAFPVGMCARTLLGKAEVVLWRIAAGVFHVHVARSLVPYAWACLEEARAEFADADPVGSAPGG